jgi:hypothetical protein
MEKMAVGRGCATLQYRNDRNGKRHAWVNGKSLALCRKRRRLRQVDFSQQGDQLLAFGRAQHTGRFVFYF